jgi:hypothetical protein
MRPSTGLAAIFLSIMELKACTPQARRYHQEKKTHHHSLLT